MKIRYRITLVYSVTVGVILLLLFIGVYFLSEQNRIILFKDRLKARALTTVRLFKTEKVDPLLIKKINRFSFGTLTQKSINIYDKNHKLVFFDSDDSTMHLQVSNDILSQTGKKTTVYFHDGKRDAIAFKSKEYIVAVAAYDDDRVEWLSKLRTILISSFLGGLALIMIVGYIFSLSLVRSIQKITDNINHITTKDLSLRLEQGKNTDELSRLAQTINHLLERLQHSFETQGRFIDNASHELSTPLAVILSQLDLIKQKPRSNEEYVALVDSIYEDVTRLNLLVKSLLNLARVHGTAKGIELSDIRIDDLLMRLPVTIKKLNPAYKVQMVFEEFPEEDVKLRVYGNEALLFSAFYNIVHNACKYTDDSAPVVRLKFEPDGMLITIEDNGPGITSSELEDVFQPFYRGININHNAVAGIGLGLSLAKNIIRLHNGTITVKSTPGEGTIFFIKLRYKTQLTLQDLSGDFESL